MDVGGDATEALFEVLVTDCDGHKPLNVWQLMRIGVPGEGL